MRQARGMQEASSQPAARGHSRYGERQASQQQPGRDREERSHGKPPWQKERESRNSQREPARRAHFTDNEDDKLEEDEGEQT